jgi:hypothetical protein
MKAITTHGKKCLFWHRWKLEKSNSITSYYSCKDCTARFVNQSGQGYQPVDWEWITHNRKQL